MKIVLLVMLVVVSTACNAFDRFAEMSATFVVYNTSARPVAVLINDGEEIALPANGSTRFEKKIQVPRQYGDSVLGPGPIDREVQVSVVFRDLTTRSLSQPIFCQAGARIITTVWYETYNERNQPRCQSTW